MTQAGFVRITSNPSFSPQAVPVRAAIALLGEIVRLPEHGFWADDLSFPQAAPKEMPIVSHRQVTDAYLISLAEAHGGMVATLDRGMLALGKTGLVEIAGWREPQNRKGSGRFGAFSSNFYVVGKSIRRR
jgi:predicted nucleic acid-binding protein